MNNRKTRILESYQHTLRHVFDGEAQLTAEIMTVARRLKAIVDKLLDSASEQHAAKTARTLGILRHDIDIMRKEQMLPLARLAKPLFVGERQVEAALIVPHKRAPTDDILSAALVMAKALKPHRKLLAETGIDALRVERLAHAAREFQKAVRAGHAKIADRAVPTRTIDALFKAARLQVLALDALVGASKAEDVKVSWKHRRTIHKRIGRPKKRKLKTGQGTAV